MNVRDALVALRLEVVFGHPEDVVAQIVHQGTDCLSLIEDCYELFVGVEAVVGGGSGETDVVQVNVSCEQASEFINHGRVSRIWC